jgi:SAM-dependent methyltransferase
LRVRCTISRLAYRSHGHGGVDRGSYSAQRTSTLGRLRELKNLYFRNARGIPEKIRYLKQRLTEVEGQLEAALGQTVRGLNMLEIGPGQHQPQQAYFTARGNHVMAVDLDVIPHSLTLDACAAMLRRNGAIRTLKTVGRKVLGLDAQFQRELERQLGVHRLAPMPVLQMDASALEFEPDRYDVVYSFSAFEHFSDPGAALAEAARVVRPGGAVYIAIHLYTSDSGIHDPRIFSGNRSGIPAWAHLRPESSHLVESNAFLNRLRLKEWQAWFDAHLPGARLSQLRDDRPWILEELVKARTEGHLSDYSDDELLTVDLCALWVKPARPAERENSGLLAS